MREKKVSKLTNGIKKVSKKAVRKCGDGLTFVIIKTWLTI